MKAGADDEFIDSVRDACMTALSWGVPEEDVLRSLIFMATWVVVENKTSDADNELDYINHVTEDLIAELNQQVLTHFGRNNG
jgi:hypothetical protein